MTRLYVDLTDLVVNSIWHGVNTGIQQVQINVAYALVKTADARAFSVYDGEFEVLNEPLLRSQGNPEEFVRKLKVIYQRSVRRREFYQSHSTLSIIARGIRKAIVSYRLSRPTTEIKSGDALLIMGAFWQYPSLIEFYEKIPKGVIIIGIIHDLIGIIYPAFRNQERVKLFRRFLELPSHLICVSEFTRVELTRAVASGSISANCKSLHVVPLAHEFLGVARNETAAPKLSEPYVLYVSAMEAHKNHSKLIDAWKELRKEVGPTLPKLILAGKRTQYTDQLTDPRNLGDSIRYIERPNNEELKRLYAGCLFTVFPSLIEGWGLPVGESLWFGKPCAASNRASLPEVGGDLCVYFDPEVIDDMKRAIRALLDSATRTAFEGRINAAKLRSWSDVTNDIDADVTKILS
jgi:glycosyltransferase involved in cell wall biosynthesis